MKEHIGEPLKYTETSMFGDEYVSDGEILGCNRPYDPRGTGTREFFAKVKMKNDLIVGVS